jgi:NAD(P)-dependent dehydrogenase (short-subunit alcohol dehydrogenase family)
VIERVAELAEQWWAATMDVNLTGAFYCCKSARAGHVARRRRLHHQYRLDLRHDR